MDSPGLENMKHIMAMVNKDPSLTLGKCHDHCITIYPRTMSSTRAAYNIRKIRKKIVDGELEGLILKNSFNRYNLYSLTICLKEKSDYQSLIDII